MLFHTIICILWILCEIAKPTNSTLIMRNYYTLIFALAAVLLVSCGGKEEKKENIQMYEPETETVVKASQKIDLESKGIGPVQSITIPAEIDQNMAALGKQVYDSKCLACHKPTEPFIGPAPVGILERRAPEWVMNMILNPEEMVQKDPLAMELLKEFNGSPMLDQNLTETEARQVLEYFRTL